MANDEAWQAGMDIAQKHRDKKDKKKKKGKGNDGDEKKSGLMSYIKKKFSSSPKQLTGNLDASPTELHKGGLVKKSGYAKVRKGEVMLTAKQARSFGRKAGKRKTVTRKRVSSKR
jgi:hypothetical protein